MFYYKAFNLIIQSSFKIDDLLKIEPNQNYNLQFKTGKTPIELKSVLSKGGSKDKLSNYQISETQFLFEYKTVGNFLIDRDASIMVEKDPNVEQQFFNIVLLNICLIYHYHFNNQFPLHASAVSFGDFCILIMGDSGAGKSTTATQFLKFGHKIVTDDLALIKFDEAGMPFVYPSYPQLRLWNETLTKLNIEDSDLVQIHHKQNKFKKTLEAQNYVTETVPLKKMYYLTFSSDEILQLTDVKGFEKVKTISANAFGDTIVNVFNKAAIYFKFCNQLASKVDISIIERPKETNTIEKIFTLIMNDLEEM